VKFAVLNYPLFAPSAAITEAIYTPSTKAAVDQHDENVSLNKPLS